MRMRKTEISEFSVAEIREIRTDDKMSEEYRNAVLFCSTDNILKFNHILLILYLK